MSDFSAFRVQEKQFSDITSPQQGVEDKSGAIAMSGLAEGLSSVAQLGSQVHSAVKQKQAAQAAASSSIEFDRVLEKASQGLRSGELTNDKANTMITMARRDLISRGADPRELDKQESGKMKTVTGKALEEGSLEDQAFDAVMKDFRHSNFYSYNASAEENEYNFARYEADKAENATITAQMRKLNLESKQINLSDARRKELEAEKRDLQKTVVTKLVGEMPSSIDSQIAKVKSDVEELLNSGKVDVVGAQKMIENGIEGVRNRIRQEIALSQAQSSGDFTEYANLANTLLDNLINTNLKYLGSGRANEILKQELNRVNLQTAAELQALPYVGVGAGIAELTNGAIGLEFGQSMKKEVNDYIINAVDRVPGQDGKNSFSVPKGDKVTADKVSDYLKITINNIKNLETGATDSLGTPLATENSVVKQVSDITDSMYRAVNSGERLANISILADRIANTNLGDFIGKNLDKFDPVDRERIQDVGNVYAQKVVESTSEQLRKVLPKEVLEDQATRENPRTRWMTLKRPTPDDIDIKVVGSAVMFVPLTEKGKKVAEGANASISGPLTTALKLAAKVTNSSLSEQLEIAKPTLWPVKYGQGMEGQEPTQEEEIDYTGYTDGVYREKDTGRNFVVRNGIRSEIGE